MNTSNFRSLTSQEISELINNNNNSENWDTFFVAENFNPALIKNNHFQGEIFLGDLTDKFLVFSQLRLPVGIYNSFLDSVIIGNHVAIHNAKFIRNYSIGDNSLIFNIGDLTCSEKAVFGNGYAEEKSQRNWVELSNENGGRKILPFEGIIEADAFLWSNFRDDNELQRKLEKYTDDLSKNELKGIIANDCCIKNTKTLIDCKIGPFSVIDGTNLLHNVTVQSNSEEVTYIGHGVDIKNGIIGFGNQIKRGAKCSDIISGSNVTIDLGARVLNTFVGTNSTISCCEVLNNLLFPFHEQHHNNSFLIASTVMGQSNIAAGATIGSNHNSRAADGEILAERGFWPGLNTSFKHNSIFAAFTLIAKTSFETELNIDLPFSLVSKDATGKIQVFPAFWFRYNMYALARNGWKFKKRDKRKIKNQHIEYNYLAPDTVWEMLRAVKVLEDAAAIKINAYDFNKITESTAVYLEDIIPKENVHIIKPHQAIWLYKNMILFFAASEINGFLVKKEWHDLQDELKNLPDLQQWLNFGGQLIAEKKVDQLIDNIKSDQLKSWDEIHKRYDALWENYPQDKLKYALLCWLKLEKISSVSPKEIMDLLKHGVKINELLLLWAVASREKDYTNPFRKMNYRNEAEMLAVTGKISDNAFLTDMKTKFENFKNQVSSILIKLENINGQ